MSLTAEAAKEILSKVTGLPEGLFDISSSRTKGNITINIIECKEESDEYTVLSTGNGEVIEIKNSYISWSKQEVAAKLKPPPVATAGAGGGLLSSNNVTSPQPIPPTHQPQPITNLFNINHQGLVQHIIDFIQLNPGCILSLFDPSDNVNESTALLPTAWAFESVDGNSSETRIAFDASGCTDQNIMDGVMAVITLDTNTGATLLCEVIDA